MTPNHLDPGTRNLYDVLATVGLDVAPAFPANHVSEVQSYRTPETTSFKYISRTAPTWYETRWYFAMATPTAGKYDFLSWKRPLFHVPRLSGKSTASLIYSKLGGQDPGLFDIVTLRLLKRDRCASETTRKMD